MGIFSSKQPKTPQIKVVKNSGGSRILDFSEFMDTEMRRRVASGVLEWMDKVDIFEAFYIPQREAEGWVLIKGNNKSSNIDDRFKVTWDVGGQIIVASYNDGKSTVTERLK